MKRVFSTLLMSFMFLAVQAQIHTPVKWKIKLEDSGKPEKEIVFTAVADKGWHLYDMNLPAGGPVSTSITYETMKGAELVGKVVSSVAPTSVYDELFAMNLRWYSGTVTFTQKIKVTDAKAFKLAGELEFMACNDETCLPPERVEFSFNRKNITMTDAGVVAGESDDQTAADSLSLAQGTDSLSVSADGENAGQLVNPTKIAEALSDNVDLWTPVIDELKAFGESPLDGTDSSLLFIFLAGFAGGFIALLTPCVWPMIPMTVSFFLKRTKNKKKAIKDAETVAAAQAKIDETLSGLSSEQAARTQTDAERVMQSDGQAGRA
ncbi:protein-disulfide reductase DsbD domain-containing protein, partial [Macellibacteroides fermentans]|uniref:protein-disulfide reductase DsbD domain-containing protein n=1 Tax=Macellibacteroides fermentans TaxID=879969 RepID=UPI002C22C10A|nr:protein-disulfide reductase DsbD family protein [Macellibacteroides fermentans]